MLLALCGVVAADPADPGARLKAIETEVKAAETAFRAAWEKQAQPWPMSPAVEKLSADYERKREAGRDAALDIARADSASETGFSALEFIMTDVQAYELPVGKAALELMAKHHAANPKVAQSVARLAYFPPYEKNASTPRRRRPAKRGGREESRPVRARSGGARAGVATQAPVRARRVPGGQGPCRRATRGLGGPRCGAGLRRRHACLRRLPQPPARRQAPHKSDARRGGGRRVVRAAQAAPGKRGARDRGRGPGRQKIQAQRLPQQGGGAEIGRASCRERG